MGLTTIGMKRYTSPLRYPGGKSRVAKELLAFFPDFYEYREPFLGGGSVFFQTRTTLDGKSYWVNDLNTNLYCFWISARDTIDQLITEINELREQFAGNGKGLYFHLKNEYQTNSILNTAVRFFILNRITYSGLTDSGGYSNESFQKRFTDSSIEKLRRISVLLQNTVITNLDYSRMLVQDGEKVFLFLDPPYYSQRVSKLYGNNGDLHVQFDHQLFAESVTNCKHNWLITYDDNPYIRSLYQDYYITDWSLQYGMNRSNGITKRGHELIITNYKYSKQEHIF